MRIIVEDQQDCLAAAVRRLGTADERWSVIPNTDLHAVSDRGRVMQVWRQRLVRQVVGHKGEYLVRISLDGVPKRRAVHRLVADAFLKNPDSHPVVRHKNGDQADNRAANLYWCPHQGTTPRPSRESDEFLLQRAIAGLTFTFIPEERWALIPSTRLNAISTEGRVLNVLTGRLLRSAPDQWGHRHVSIAIAGVRKTPSVHRLVATAFIPNPDGLPVVRHLDDNKTNNTMRNLRWGTHEDNLADMASNRPTLEGLRGHRGMLLPADLVDLIGDRDWRGYVLDEPAVLTPFIEPELD